LRLLSLTVSNSIISILRRSTDTSDSSNIPLLIIVLTVVAAVTAAAAATAVTAVTISKISGRIINLATDTSEGSIESLLVT
jgi:hypothetical protein